MSPRKLSGARNRKRKAEREAEERKVKGSLVKFLQPVPGPSAEPVEDAKYDELNVFQALTAEVTEESNYEEDGFEASFSSLNPNIKKSTGEGYQEERISYSNSPEVVYPANVECFSEDLGDPALWPMILQQSFIDSLISWETVGTLEIGDMEFPKDDKGRRFSKSYLLRKLENGEEVKRRWLLYSKSSDRAFCLCCKLFNKTNVGQSQLGTSGFRDWAHLSTRLKEHERSPEHIKSYCKWMEAASRLDLQKTIDVQHQHQIKQEVKHWQLVLERLMAITLFLSQHNLGFRGSSDKLFTANNGNFLGLVEMFGKFDDVMREHLRRIRSNEISDHYCGKRIQNEFIDILAKQVLDKILSKVKIARYYSLILDCTPDVSHSEKMSFTIRFVDIQSNEVSVKEHFIGFREALDSTGEGLTELVLLTLREHGLRLEDIRGQGYDNAANMKGKHKGVKSRILSMNPRAAYVACGCHLLNLLVSDAASSNKMCLTLFGVIQRIYVLFSASVQRWEILLKHVSSLTVKPLSETRWESRIDSVKAIRYQSKEVYTALEEISESPAADAGLRHEAACLGGQLMDFKFLITLCVWYDILHRVNIVSKSMQKEDMDLPTVAELLKGCTSFFSSYRENGYIEAVMKAKDIAETLDAECIFKDDIRNRNRKKMFPYEGEDDRVLRSAEERFKTDFFYVTVDSVQQSLENRFDLFNQHQSLWGFLYNLNKLPENLSVYCNDLHLALTDGDCSDISGQDLMDELHYLRNIIPQGEGSPRKVIHFINKSSLQDAFPNVWVALRILLTLPVSVASGERSFSKLKLIKSYLRSTMADERLTSLALLSIENAISNEIDFSQTVHSFAEKKARKVNLT